MKESLKRFVFFILFWLLFFALCRLVFVLSIISKWKEEGVGQMLRAFLYGIPMDLSAAAYLGLLPLLIWSFYFIAGKNPIRYRVYHIYSVVLIALISIFAVIDFNIYREWSTKLNYKAFQIFFNSPYLAMVSSSSSPVLPGLIAGIFLMVAGFVLYHYLKPQFRNSSFPPLPIRILFVLGLFVAEVFFLRGGFSTSPLTISSSYYSNNQALNHAAVNTEWNLLRDIIDSKQSVGNPYLFMSAKESKQITDSLLLVQDSTELFLTTKQPNVVLLILESFTADLIEPLGGEKGVTPFIDSLMGHSLSFSNIYSTGSRTDIGFVSIHSGFPSQPLKSILSVPEKATKLPSISSALFHQGYHTSYYYGGESEFFNFRAFILSKDYQRLTDIRNFKKDELNSKWGAHDGVVLQRAVQDLNQEKEPFFSTIMTLSNHEPFEVPGARQFPGNDLGNKFRSTAYYTDQSLKAFFATASKQSWYKNTLFVIVADHGHRLPKDVNEVYMPQRSHIPLFFYGDVIAEQYRGKVMDKVGSQADLPASVLAQLGIPHKEFYWSKNLMNPFSNEFAFNTFDNGFMWMGKNQQIGFDCNSKKVNYRMLNNQPDSQEIRLGKAFLQEVYTQYLAY